MPEQIFETIVTTRDEHGLPHIVPLGIRHIEGFVVLAPFRPSKTLDNVLRERHAVVNYTDEVRVFAGCLTGRHDWPTVESPAGPRLASGLAHDELELVRIEEDELRPRLFMRLVRSGTHGSFQGFNRAQAAVVEACILVSRLHLLTEEKIRSELAYLSIAIEKTAGIKEREAWNWLIKKIEDHYQASPKV